MALCYKTMLTFLFDEYKENIMGQYKLRLATIYIFLIGILCLVGAALTVPTYILLDARLTSANLEKSATNTTESTDSIEKEITSIKRKITTLEIDSNETPIATILERILSKKDDDIRIDTIALRRNVETGAISILGVAPSRDALVAFSKRLQGESSFTNVNLPVGSLTRNKDVPFSISIDTKI